MAAQVLGRPEKGNVTPHSVAIYGLGAGNRTRCQNVCVVFTGLYTDVMLQVFNDILTSHVVKRENSQYHQ